MLNALSLTLTVCLADEKTVHVFIEYNVTTKCCLTTTFERVIVLLLFWISETYNLKNTTQAPQSKHFILDPVLKLESVLSSYY